MVASRSLSLLLLLSQLRLLLSYPVAGNTLSPQVTVNYNMVCTLQRQPLHEASDKGASKRLHMRSASLTSPPRSPVEFRVLLNNGTGGRKTVELYIHPKVDDTTHQTAIEPSPIAIEVAKFGKCENYNHFMMEWICDKLSNVTTAEQKLMQPYPALCRSQLTASDRMAAVHSVFSLYNVRLNRYLCVSRNGSVYASQSLLAECFLFIRQFADSESRTKPTCFASESRRLQRSAMQKQARASDYFLMMSAVYPRPVLASDAKCTFNGLQLVFDGVKRWLLGVSLTTGKIVRQKRIDLNTLWKFDTVRPAPDRNLPVLGRPDASRSPMVTSSSNESTLTAVTVRTANRTTTDSSATVTNRTTTRSTTQRPSVISRLTTLLTGSTRSSSIRRGAQNRRDRSRNRQPDMKVAPISDLNQLVFNPHSGSFLDQLLQSANLTLPLQGAQQVKEEINNAAMNRQRRPQRQKHPSNS